MIMSNHSNLGSNPNPVTNCFTVDLEDWYQGNEHIKMADSHLFEDRIENSTQVLLDLLDEYGVKATFFVLGHIAEKKRNLISEIFHRGHEIASHGYSHELVYSQSPEEFRNELLKSKNICEDIIGAPIIGHRASNWSITQKSLWALEIIREAGFLYDSSIYPIKNYLFGIANAPRFSHLLSNGLLEIPPSTARWAKRNIPYSGGFFLRAMPLPAIGCALRSVHREGQPAVFYIHPWELDCDQPYDLPVPIKNKLIHYFGLKTVEKKLRNIFSEFAFGRMDRVFSEHLLQPRLKEID